MCTCHDRAIDHAFDDDIDQYVVPGRQNTPQEATERPQETSSGKSGATARERILALRRSTPYTEFEEAVMSCTDDGCCDLCRGVDQYRPRVALGIHQKEQELRAYLSADRDEGDQR